MKTKPKKWLKKRHKFYWAVANALLAPTVKHKYRMQIDKFADGKGQYLVLSNHQTPFDQFFVSRLFGGYRYFVTTEDLLSNRLISKALQHTVAPIPFQKGTADAHSMKICLRIAREGGTVVLYPEGNRTYSGKTAHIKPSVVKLVRLLKLPVALVVQRGGYGLEPRWSNVVRKGKGRIGVQKVLTPDQYGKMTDEELYQCIVQTLTVDETKDGEVFKSNRRAEYLERMLFVCPHCGLSYFESHGNHVKCLQCNTTVCYGENKMLAATQGELPFATIGEWYDYQQNYVNSLTLEQLGDQPLYFDKVTLNQVIVGKCKRKLQQNATLVMFANRLEVRGKKQTLVFHYDQINAMAVLGRNKLNFYCNDNILQVKGQKRFNALKYMFVYYRTKNIKENNNGTFLGI